jgi:probable HAF family extracellular repeat protein
MTGIRQRRRNDLAVRAQLGRNSPAYFVHPLQQAAERRSQLAGFFGDLLARRGVSRRQAHVGWRDAPPGGDPAEAGKVMRRTLKTALLSLAIGWAGAGLSARTDGRANQTPGIRYSVTDLGTLGGTLSEAWGINDAGQIVGRASLAGDLNYHAFLYENGVMTDLGTIGPGCSTGNSWAFDINDSGQIVGRTCSNGIAQRAFLRSGGTMLDLGTLGGTGSWARGVNNAGDVVGSAALPSDAGVRAFLYRTSPMHDLGTLGGHSEAHHVNDSGTIVGYSEISLALPARHPHAFLYSNGTMTDLTPTIYPACCSWAWGINNAGKVVGMSLDRAFLHTNGSMIDLGTLAGGQTVALSINDHDQIVGYSALGYNYFHAFLYRNGLMVDLNDHVPDSPGWDLNFATSINDAGQIVGIGIIGGQTHGFLLTPVPAAVDDAYTTPFQVPLTVPAPGVLANDTNAGTGWMVAELVTTVTHGALTFNADGGFRYTPAAGYAGPDSFTYRAANVHGPGNVATVILSVSEPTVPQPPTELFTYSVAGDVVTLRWLPPLIGPRPTGYTVEGGINSGDVLAIIPTGSSYPIYTFVAPQGSFYLRVHAVVGAAKSAPSNEIRLHVRVPVPPSPPASLTSLVNGSTVSLTWRNTFTGGPPTTVVLEAQAGQAVVYIPLGLTDTFTAGGVPTGTYTLRVWAVNAGGVSGPSNALVVTIPGGCSGPLPPSSFLAYAMGRTIFVMWDPPTTGPAATEYELIVDGTFAGRFRTPGRALSGTVGPGTYHLSVMADNACGSSQATPAQTVSIQ